MKIRVLDRILVALAGLLMLAGGAALAAQLFFGKDVVGRVASWLTDDSLRAYIIIAGIVIFLLGVYCVLLLFRHRGRNGKFIMQRTDSGELAISLKALETMVQKCLDQHKELNAQSVNLENQRGSLLIRIRGTVAGGISIPLTVDTLQQQIKQYVTACSGVEVRDIRVEIESSGPDAKDAPFAIEGPAAIGLLKGAGEAQTVQAELKPEEKEEPAAPVQAETAAAAAPEEARQTDDELSAAAAAAAMLMDTVPEEEDDRPMHQRLFSKVGAPCVMPMPPRNLEDEKAETDQADGEIPPETKPAEDQQAEMNDGETFPEAKPAEDQQAEKNDGEIPPEAKPADDQQAEKNDGETAPEEIIAGEKASGENTPGEDIPEEIIPEDTGIAEPTAAEPAEVKETMETDKEQGGAED